MRYSGIHGSDSTTVGIIANVLTLIQPNGSNGPGPIVVLASYQNYIMNKFKIRTLKLIS